MKKLLCKILGHQLHPLTHQEKFNPHIPHRYRVMKRCMRCMNDYQVGEEDYSHLYKK